MKWHFPVVLLVLGVLLVAAAPGVAVADQRLPAIRPGPKDKCPVCGMFVAKYPDWVAQIRYEDGTTLFFDGVKDLFKFYFQQKGQPQKNSNAAAAIYATDYYTFAPITADTAHFVAGSDVYGPMGKELVAFSTAAHAETFLRDHHGREILRFDAITPALIGTLD